MFKNKLFLTISNDRKINAIFYFALLLSALLERVLYFLIALVNIRPLIMNQLKKRRTADTCQTKW